MTRTSEAPEARIDAIMEKASKALVERRYFDAERLCLEALDLAHNGRDYERMARICLPLQESRRQKRDLAADSGEVFLVDGELPKPGKLRPGCYLVRPPRVGLDGRMLRELADSREVPAIVIVREPTTRAGLWPVVVLGPVTIRSQIAPPPPPKPKKKPGKKPADAPTVEDSLPPVTWFLAASEALGDAAIASVDPNKSPLARVEEFLMRLQAHPDHEKLHQALMTACEIAAQLPEKERRAQDPTPERISELDDSDADSDIDGG